MDGVMHLLSFSLMEPETPLFLYSPGWLNVWEAYSYNIALKNTGANSWAFKRFGTREDAYHREIVNRTNYIDYISAIEKVSDSAMQTLSQKERMLMMKSRTAFIYVDSWGEAAGFEYDISTLHLSTIDTLPKNLVKKFSVDNVTCKIRGEKKALIQAMRLAQDYLSWDIFDFVIICGGYRAIPLLAFTAADINPRRKMKKTCKIPGMNLSIERVGCFIFSQTTGDLKINCGPYLSTDSSQYHKHHESDIDLIAFSGGGCSITPFFNNPVEFLDLENKYGCSGCITPALSWHYIGQHAFNSGRMRTILSDCNDGLSYFDTWY
ncbi:ATP-binding protein [Klebsiella michiganensis]|uniref:ATP-binding protein n=1 Tax=Klebsiella michiganensis TaxID=1134687 RepID=UPI001367D8E0|nr:ATP-binding protein [Klebsiella michiganensis]MEB8292588.1 ATP-binding protein [Klebsiella michiganensis]MXJ81460.1 ATP-binding protein [Klebsiella michiganensis]